MSENKNCPGAATPEQQAEKESFGEGTISNFKYTTNNGNISRFLSHGKENSIPLRQLEAITGLDERVVRSIIFAERLRGIPILSDSGYYLPANEQEKTRFVRSMRHRAKEIQRVADAIEKVQL